MTSYKTSPALQESLRRSFWQCVAAGLLASILVHLALIFLFRPPTPKQAPSVKGARFTVMLNPALLTTDDQWGLRSALKYGDPSLFAKPDDNFGFSSYRSIKQAESKLPPDLGPDSSNMFSALQQGRFFMARQPWRLCQAPPRDWLHYEELLAKFNHGALLPKPVPQTPPPIWLDTSFVPVAKLSDPRGEIAKALSENKQPLGDTVLILQDAGADLPPALRVFRSCGSARLDSLALRSLSFSVESMPSVAPPRDGYSILLLKWTQGSQLPAAMKEGPAQ